MKAIDKVYAQNWVEQYRIQRTGEYARFNARYWFGAGGDSTAVIIIRTDWDGFFRGMWFNRATSLHYRDRVR